MQSKYPAQGFVDRIITPSFGFGLVIVNDILDRYVVEKFEDKVSSPFARAMVRSWIGGPSRSFANALAFRTPWSRDNRAGLKTYLTKKERAVRVR